MRDAGSAVAVMTGRPGRPRPQVRSVQPIDERIAATPELFGDMSHRTTITDHPLNERTTAVQLQTSLSVGHEDLLVGSGVRHLH